MSHITLLCTDFKCKMTTPLQKLMAAFCQKQGVAQNTVRFLFDGERIAPTATPKDLDMEDGDVIDVMVEQVGGLIGGHQPEHLVSAHSHAATQAATQAVTRAA